MNDTYLLIYTTLSIIIGLIVGLCITHDMVIENETRLDSIGVGLLMTIVIGILWPLLVVILLVSLPFILIVYLTERKNKGE